MTPAKFYADLNPRYVVTNIKERRWRVFISFDVKGITKRERLINIVEAAGSTSNRRVAENKAKLLQDVFDELNGIFVEVKV
jgi:hypothetical protein